MSADERKVSNVVGARAERLSREAGEGKLKWNKERTKRLFMRYKKTGDESAREQLVMSYLNLVRFLAAKFKNRGEPLEDLVQVGNIGLIKAIDRFDPDRGLEFTTYATPTILGEIKRHFRDRGWAVRVPRRLQELSAKVTKATDELTQELQRPPKMSEIAEHLGVSVDEVLEALASSSAYSAVSLEAPRATTGEEGMSVLDRYENIDQALASSDDRLLINAALEDFSEKEREIVKMRFVDGLTQVEIAEALGVSQVQISRFLRRTLTKLRSKIDR